MFGSTLILNKARKNKKTFKYENHHPHGSDAIHWQQRCSHMLGMKAGVSSVMSFSTRLHGITAKKKEIFTLAPSACQMSQNF
jgi:hypothetical protein